MLMLNSKIGSQNLLSILCFRCLFQVWDHLSMILWQIHCLHAKWFTRDSFHKWNYVATEIAVLCLVDLVLLINFQILLLHILNIQQKFIHSLTNLWRHDLLQMELKHLNTALLYPHRRQRHTKQKCLERSASLILIVYNNKWLYILNKYER